MVYSPDYPVAPVDFVSYMDKAIPFISRRGRALVTLMELAYDTFKNLYDYQAQKYCISWQSGGTNGVDRVDIANYLSADQTLSLGALHMMRKELVCLLTDLYLYAEFPIASTATTPAQAGTGAAGAIYPTSYVVTESNIRELATYAKQIRVLIGLLDDSYASYRNLVRPYLTKLDVVIAPKTDAEMNAIHAASCMSSSRTGLVHANRAALAQYLVDSVELWSIGQW